MRILVDAGSGSLANLQKYVSIHDLDAIWISHLHVDHCSDLVLAYYLAKYGISQREELLPVYGPPGWHDHICRSSVSERSLADFFQVHELHDGAQVAIGSTTVLTAIRTTHSVDTYGLRVTDGSATTIAYSADSASCEALGRIGHDATLFLCEAAVLDHSRESPANHLTPSEAAEWATRANASKLLLTHVRPDSNEKVVLELAGTLFGDEIHIAYEGDVFTY
jgi:ribonuclease BN (tRNA processing enzyme)